MDASSCLLLVRFSLPSLQTQDAPLSGPVNLSRLLFLLPKLHLRALVDSGMYTSSCLWLPVQRLTELTTSRISVFGYLKVKSYYGLSIDTAEKAALTKYINAC